MPHVHVLPCDAGDAYEIAKAVCDCAPGGGILMTSDTFFKLPHHLLVAPRHDHTRRMDQLGMQPQAQGTMRRDQQPINALIVYAGDHSMEKMTLKAPVALASGAQVPTGQQGGAGVLERVSEEVSGRLQASQPASGMVPQRGVLSLFHAVPSGIMLRLGHSPPLRYCKVRGGSDMCAHNKLLQAVTVFLLL